MRGRKHRLFIVSQGDPDTGEVVRDPEGRWTTRPEEGAADEGTRTEVMGFIGFVPLEEREHGVDHTAVAQVPTGTPVGRGSDLIADTGDPNLDGRYEIVGSQPGPTVDRLLLRRSAP